MHWEDEKLVSWMQAYPGTRKSIINTIIRRYKNLIFKELAKQCDPRYDRDDLSQQIILIFVQLLEEFDASKGVPLAGFLKSKLTNRVYNFFKSQVKTWKGEIPSEIFNNDDEEGIVGIYEFSGQDEFIDIWCDIYKSLPKKKFEALYWKYRANFCNSEIGIVLNITPEEANKLVDLSCNALRYCYPFLEKYSPRLLESAVKKGQDKNKNAHAIKNLYHSIRQVMQNITNVDIRSKEAEKHAQTIKLIIRKAESHKIMDMRNLVDSLIKDCNLTGTNPYATTTQTQQ